MEPRRFSKMIFQSPYADGISECAGTVEATRTSYMFMSAPPQKTSSEQQNSVRTCKGHFHDLGAPIADCKGNLGLPDGFLQVQC